MSARSIAFDKSSKDSSGFLFKRRLFTTEVELTNMKIKGLKITLKKLSGLDINSEKRSEYFAAYTFGMISPKRSSKKVTTTMVNKKGTHAGELLKSRIALVKYVEIITIPTFTKLLTISMVANKCSGFFSNFNTSILFLLFFVFRLSKLAGDKEKNATSEPEIKAELSNNRIIIDSPKKLDGSGFLKTILVNVLISNKNGSVSKINYVGSTSMLALKLY